MIPSNAPNSGCENPNVDLAADENKKTLGWMVIRALDEWSLIQYYHQLLEFETIESDESIALLTDCYMKLSERHREELNLLLKNIYTLITGKEAS